MKRVNTIHYGVMMRLLIRSAACYLVVSLTVFAQDEAVYNSLSGKYLKEIDFLREQRVELGGWASVGGIYSTDNPHHHNNFPITFNDRSSEIHLNQINFYLQRSIGLEAHNWDVGGRIDFMFGTDSRFTQATGLDNNLIHQNDLRFYDIAIPQAYLEIFAPIGNGLSAKIGHFYTILGQEAVMSPKNFFYSHSFTMQYAEPFTHTGTLFNYALSDAFTLNAGAVAGWDNFGHDLSNWNFLSGISWTNKDTGSAVALSIISGDIDDVRVQNRTVYTLVISQNFTEKLNLIFQHDFGFQERANSHEKDTFWYGINQYLIYEFSDAISTGIRIEWFRDADGVRIIPGNAGHYFALTAGVNWKPQAWLTLRPECRYDWAESTTKVFDNQTKNTQLEFAMDIVINF